MARIHILGAGTPTPTPTRFGSSYVVEVGDDQIMVDCGPAATYKLVQAGLWPTNIDYLFFTHHHFDHDVDYPCFLLCRWDQSIGQEGQLQVFGPTPTEKITEGTWRGRRFRPRLEGPREPSAQPACARQSRRYAASKAAGRTRP